MHAVVAETAGGPEVLRWVEVEDPRPGPGEVLLEVAASAVNRADLLQRQGFYPPPPGASPILGLECSGTVLARGDEVDDWSPGDEVCALLAGGGYATRVAVPEGQLMPLPPGVDLVTAAALPEVACTVHSNLGLLAGLRVGETLLVHGGASGIGTFALQYGHALGARVATTARASKLARCREFGAALAIDYQTEDFVRMAREFTGGPGVDVILDIMGAAYLGRNVEALAPNGRLVVIGMQGGTRAELDLGTLLMKRATVHATSLRGRPVDEKARICAAVVRDVWPLVGAGAIRPVVERALPMPEAGEAHRVVESGAHVGKILLVAPGYSGVTSAPQGVGP